MRARKVVKRKDTSYRKVGVYIRKKESEKSRSDAYKDTSMGFNRHCVTPNI